MTEPLEEPADDAVDRESWCVDAAVDFEAEPEFALAAAFEEADGAGLGDTVGGMVEINLRRHCVTFAVVVDDVAGDATKADVGVLAGAALASATVARTAIKVIARVNFILCCCFSSFFSCYSLYMDSLSWGSG